MSSIPSLSREGGPRQGVNGPELSELVNYDVSEDTINAELQAMFDSGQRRLRIPIFFVSSGNTYNAGYIVTPGGVMPNRYRNNLVNLLASIRRIGYEEVIVGFFQLGDNFPETGHNGGRIFIRTIGSSCRTCGPFSSERAFHMSLF